MFINDIRQQLYSSFTSPVSHELLQDSSRAFLNFLKEVPDAQKRTLHFKAPYDRASPDGYTDKRSAGGKDPKELFHWNYRIVDSEAYKACSLRYASARHFFDTAEEVFIIIERTAVSIILTEFPEQAQYVVANGRLVNATLRYNCYTPNDEVTFTAQPHYDKSYFTIALAESAPGFRIGCCQRCGPTEIPHQESTALFFAGKLPYHDSNGRILPGWHDVVAHPTTKPVNERCKRWSIVLFIDDIGGRCYLPHKEVHTAVCPRTIAA